jgi:hypothetical protein
MPVVAKAVLRGLILLAACAGAGAGELPDARDLAKLDGVHDLSLPDWGPYTKNYIGVSHINDRERGLRFDLSVFPGLYRRRVELPNVDFESGFHPWEAAADLSYFSFRHDIEWKDRVYADISYSAYGEDARLIRAQLVNHTDLPQSLVLHFLASIHFPSIKPYAPDEALRIARAELPPGAQWVDALDYQELQFHTPRARDGLVYDGWRRGEIRRHGFVNGSGIGNGFGRERGDRLRYRLQLQKPLKDARLLLRYRSGAAGALALRIDGGERSELALAASGEEPRTASVDLGALDAGEHSVEFTALGGGELELDGFALAAAGDEQKIRFPVHEWQPQPQITPIDDRSLLIKYPDSESYYGLRWYDGGAVVREILQGSLDGYFQHITNDHTRTRFEGDGKGHYLDLFMRPLNLAPDSERSVYAFVCNGSREAVLRKLRTLPEKTSELQAIYHQARDRLPDLTPVSAGGGYQFSQRLLASVLLTNTVFPVYTQGQYVRHSAPGRWWDSLYTWDSGFIGLGLLDLDARRSLENLNAYLTRADSQSAFIHHGTPLPVQHYQFQALWNRTQSRAALRYFYPKLKRYYDFLAGNDPRSFTRPFSSGLINTWPYFYNSGGWDDYPAQSHVHKEQIAGRVAPAVSTAHVIRAAKILQMAAAELGLEDDVAQYRRDVARFSKALNDYSWDENAGYFSYVLHDNEGQPSGVLRTETGENFNKGLDGAAPLVSGITGAAQNAALLAHLKNPRELLSPVGLSAVDQSASYYRNDGYWNGTVWMPHQWFMWKALLDLGEYRFAYQLAIRALDVWKRETEDSYNSYEHFVIATGRGAGWHQFGALSAPVLDWYTSYFRPGHLTGGLNLWVESSHFNRDNTALDAELRFYPDMTAAPASVILVLNDRYDYHAELDGKPLQMLPLHPGAYVVQLPQSGGRLRVRRTGQ